MGKCGIGVKIGDDMNRQLLHRLGGIFDTPPDSRFRSLPGDLFPGRFLLRYQTGSHRSARYPAAGTTVAGYRFGGRGERHFPYRRDFVVGTEC